MPVLGTTVDKRHDADAHTRFWLGFVSGLAGFIAADTSEKDTAFVMTAAVSAMQDVALEKKKKAH